MIQPVSWRGAPVIWGKLPWPFVFWAPHTPVPPSCDPRNPPPPGGWPWNFASQVWPEKGQ